MAVQSRAIDDRRRGERHGINPEFAALEPGTLTYVSNLSEYGVFIHTRVRLPVGAAVDLRFTVLLDDPVVIHGPGRVVGCYRCATRKAAGVEDSRSGMHGGTELRGAG